MTIMIIWNPFFLRFAHPPSHALISIINELAPNQRLVQDLDEKLWVYWDDTMGRRVRESEKEWVPYTLVIGEKEAHDGHLSVRDRVTGKTAPMQYEEFLSLLREQTSGMPYAQLNSPILISRRPQIMI